MLPPERLQALARILSECGKLRLAVLFGSHAQGMAHPESDVDIGILPHTDLSLSDELSLARALQEAVDLPVDLVRLDRGDALLGREVASHGVCLIEKTAGAYAAYRAVAMQEWIDFDETTKPHRAALLQRLVGK